MKNLKIGAKIMLGFCIVIILMIAIAITVLLANSSTIRNVDGIAHNTALQFYANELSDIFFQARLSTRMIMLGYDMHAYNDTVGYLNECNGMINKMNAHIKEHPELEIFRQDISDAKACIETFRATAELLQNSNIRMKNYINECDSDWDEIKTQSDKLDERHLRILREANPGNPIDYAALMDDLDVCAIISSIIADAREMVNHMHSTSDPTLLVPTLEMLNEISATASSYSGEAEEITKMGELLFECRERLVEFYDELTRHLALVNDTMVYGSEALNSISIMRQRINIAVSGQVNDTESTARNSLATVVAIAAGAVAVSIALAIIISRSITVPVKKVLVAAEALAGGDTQIYVDYYSRDEIGKLAKSFGKVINTLQAVAKDIDMLIHAATAGQLDVRADSSRHEGDFKQIVEGINETIQALVTPVYLISGAMSELVEGNLSVRIEGEHKGEYGAIQQSINFTLEAINAYIRQVSEALSSMAAGDLRVEIKSGFKGDFSVLKDAINIIAFSFGRLMADIGAAAEQVDFGINRVASGAQSVSQGAADQAGAIEELTITISEMARKTKKAADDANDTRMVTHSVKKYSIEGAQSMQNMQKAMNDINDSSDNISKIIRTIDDIAFQTNILALNAAVEAARAGEHGKGFAVVAAEVRGLASKSANAAKETTELIEGSIENVAAGAKITNSTSAALEKIVESVSIAEDVVGTIAVAANDEATAIGQVSTGIEQLSNVVQINAATAEETAAAAQQLSTQSEMLKQFIARFKY